MRSKEIHVNELEEYIQTLTREVMRDHEKRFMERMRSVREAAANLSNAAARFESAVRVAWGTLEKTTSEYGVRLAHIIEDNALTISKYDISPDYLAAEQFHDQSIQTSNKIVLSVRRYVPKLHRTLRTELATLGSALTKLEIAIKSLGSALDQSPGSKLESLTREIKHVTEIQGELLSLRSQERLETETLKGLSEEKDRIDKELKALLSGPEFQELKKYEDSLRVKEDEINQFFQPLVKPLLKLERMASMKQASIDIRLLRDLVNNPVQTVVASQSYAVAMLMDTLKEKMNQHLVDFEEKKRRKAEEAIQALKEGTVDKLRDDYSALQANSQETVRQLRSKGLWERKEALDMRQNENRNRIEASSATKDETERKLNEVTRTILKEKAAVENQISVIANQSITITVE